VPVNQGRITTLKINCSLNSGLIKVTEPDESRNKGVTIRPIMVRAAIAIMVKTISSAAKTWLLKSHSEA
jgi:hypothetical protein